MTNSLIDLFGSDDFVGRHIGPRPDDLAEMLSVIGVSSVDELIDETVPAPIRMDGTSAAAGSSYASATSSPSCAGSPTGTRWPRA